MKRKKFIAAFYRQLAILLEAGYSLIRALEILANRSSTRRYRSLIQRLNAALQRGNAFWESLDNERAFFPPTDVQMVRAGEFSGSLPLILNQLADAGMREIGMINRIRATMLYPGIVMLFGVGLIVFLSKTIVPTFGEMYAEMDKQLPLPTRIVIGLNEAAQYHWWRILIVLAAAAVILWLVGRWQRVRYVIDAAKLRFTPLGPLTKEYIVVHTCTTLAMLLKAGINLVRALELTRDAASNRVVSEGLEHVRNEVTAGRGMEAPLRKARIFPEVVVDMIATATESGTLDQNLTRAAQIYEQELDGKMRNLASLAEPFLVATVGGLVMLVAFALFMPYFELLSNMSAQ
jgi:type II secretory pathway component PulF